MSRQLEAPRRLIDGRLQPFRSALSRHTRYISSGLALVVSSGLAVVVLVLRAAGPAAMQHAQY
jgi:hypothetical protein